MRSLFLCALFIALATRLLAQQPEAEYARQCDNFLAQVLPHPAGLPATTSCAAAIPAAMWEDMAATLDTTVFALSNTYGHYRRPASGSGYDAYHKIADTVTLSAAELEYVKGELHKKENSQWSIYEHYSGVAFIAKTAPKDFPGHAIQYISRPIFLRGNTVCIFYHAEDAPEAKWQAESCGLYRKNGEKWELVATLYQTSGF